MSTHAGSCLRHKSNLSLQQPPLRILFISSRPASVRAEFSRSLGSEHSKVQRNLGCHPWRVTLATNQKAHRVQKESTKIQKETENILVPAVLSASVDPNLMKGLTSALYYYIYYIRLFNQLLLLLLLKFKKKLKTFLFQQFWALLWIQI